MQGLLYHPKLGDTLVLSVSCQYNLNDYENKKLVEWDKKQCDYLLSKPSCMSVQNSSILEIRTEKGLLRQVVHTTKLK